MTESQWRSWRLAAVGVLLTTHMIAFVFGYFLGRG